MNGVSAAFGGESGFHLNAQPTATSHHHKIERQAVTVRLADGETHAGSFENEDQLREFAFLLAVFSLDGSAGMAHGAAVGEFGLGHGRFGGAKKSASRGQRVVREIERAQHELRLSCPSIFRITG
jgi:hypothetical protein